MRTLKKIVTTLLVIATVFCLFGCSGTGLFGKETKSNEEYKKEATDISMRLAKRIISGDYETISYYIHKDDATDDVKNAIKGMSAGLIDDALLVIEEVDMNTVVHSANVTFRASVNFKKSSYSMSFVMKLVNEDGHWYINNIEPVVADIRTLSRTYEDRKKKDNE